MRQPPHAAKLAIACLLAVCLDARAQSAVREFNIPAGDMMTAMDTYAAQSGAQLLYKVADVAGLAGTPVRGRMTPEAALSRLLDGTPLRAVRDGADAMVIVRSAARPAARVAVEARGEAATVIVSGVRGGPEEARDRKRYADVMVDAVAAADIARLQGQNAAQAAQRIPGVQVQRYLEEGGAFAIRGLKQSKVLLNGLEVYGAKAQTGEANGRNLDLEDVPADVLAGVDVVKSSVASDVEGGLGGMLNLRTRQPFDIKGSTANLAVKETHYEMAPGFGGKRRAQASGLISRRWTTDVGELGVLLNLAHAGSVFGLTEDEVQRPHSVGNYAGSGKTVTLPIGMFTGNGHNGERERDTHVAAFQWRPGASVSLYADYFNMNYLLDQRFQTARLYAGRPTSDYDLWGERNGDGSDDLRRGTFADSTMTSASVVGNEGRKLKLYDLGGQWGDGGRLTVKARLSHNDTAVRNTLVEWGTYAGIPMMSLAINDGAASHVSVSGVDLTDRANYRPAYLLSIAADGTQKSTAATLDANVRFDHPTLRSVDVGLRRNGYTRQAFGFVHEYCIDGCNGGTSLAAVDPALLYQVPAAQSREIGVYPAFSIAAVRQQAALRALYGLPAVDTNMPDYAQRNHERTTAAYVKFNFATDVAGNPASGNVGVRYVDTALHGESYGADAAGAPAPQASDSMRQDVLPSFNAKVSLRDDLVFRLAASKTVGQLNFSYLHAGLRILNPVQHDAEEGNPDLKPYTSRNVDLALEHYSGAKGMAFLNLFYKLADGFVQTVAQTRTINGEQYRVATYKQMGLSRIKGIEIAYRQFFARLPAPFDGLGVQASGTFVDTQAPSSIAGRDVPLVGLSRNSCNFIGIYERGRVKAHLAFNHRSSFVATTSSSGAQGVPVFVKAFGTLDFAVGFDITRQLSLVLDGANMTGAHIEQYYGDTHHQMNYVPLNKRYGVQMRYIF
jgi:iron complex outermembrane recepter protein